MRFLARFRNDERLTPKDIPTVSERARRLLKEHHASVGNIRVTGVAIELDLFPPNERQTPGLAGLLEKELGSILTLRQLDTPTLPPTNTRDVVESARRLFNEERFWETHEEVEALWKIRTGEEKELLQGFILVAVAFVHLQKDEKQICLSVLRRALLRFPAEVNSYESLDVRTMKTRVSSILESQNPESFKI